MKRKRNSQRPVTRRIGAPSQQTATTGKKSKRKLYQKKKNHLINCFLTLFICIGFGIMCYPTVSNWWNRRSASHSVDVYRAAVEVMTREDIDAMLKEAVDYNTRLATKTQSFRLDPAELKEYQSILDITGTGIMGYVNIPKADIVLPIYHTTSDEVLQIAAGHITGTSFPVGGINTNAVISGHRGLPSAKLFTDIDKLEIGDIFTITILDRVLTYQVDQIRIVVPQDIHNLLIEKGKDYCTLQTCTPYGINTHRLLIRGRRIDVPTAEKINGIGEAIRIPYFYVVPAIGLPMLFLLLLAALWEDRKQYLHNKAKQRQQERRKKIRNKNQP